MEIKFFKKSVYDWHSSRLALSRNNENVTKIYAVMMSDKCMQWNR